MNKYGVFSLLLFVGSVLSYIGLRYPETNAFLCVGLWGLFSFFGLLFAVQMKTSILSLFASFANGSMFFFSSVLFMLINF